MKAPAGGKVLKIAAWILVAAAAVGLVRLKLVAPVRVEVARPQRGVLVEEVFGTGTLESKVVVGVSSKIVGKVVEVLVDQGDTVTNGQALARLEARDFEDAVSVAQAKLGQAQAELAKAKLDLERSQSLLQGKTISQAEFDRTQTDVQVAEARLNNAEAELGFARARLADTQIVSPIAGLVVTRNLEAGSTVVPGAPIFRVADTAVVWVHAQVDESDVGKLKPGQPVRVVFRSHTGASLPGRLVRLHREADRVTEELEVDVALEALPANFFFGQKADVFIETARQPDALQIAKGALVNGGVFVVANGRAQWRTIRIGLIGRDNVAVVAGLTESDQVVAQPYTGKKRLADGQRVRTP
ncbi:MAG: Macrolide export protein MacA [Verrucomicrobiae bacterium]|nr:Macrolide export protein MacA [Verrucomicrobiae bacterium]